MLCFIKLKNITFNTQKRGIIHWFEIKNPTNTSQKDIKSYFLPCRKSLIAESPSCHSNMNCKCNRKIVSRDILWSPGLWCSTKTLMLKFSIFAVIFISTHGIAVSNTKRYAVITTFKSRFSVKKKVSVVITLFWTIGIRLFCKREPSVLFYNTSAFIISVYNLTPWFAFTTFSS